MQTKVTLAAILALPLLMLACDRQPPQTPSTSTPPTSVPTMPPTPTPAAPAMAPEPAPAMPQGEPKKDN